LIQQGPQNLYSAYLLNAEERASKIRKLIHTKG
jgi:hypothetical protein